MCPWEATVQVPDLAGQADYMWAYDRQKFNGMIAPIDYA